MKSGAVTLAATAHMRPAAAGPLIWLKILAFCLFKATYCNVIVILV